MNWTNKHKIPEHICAWLKADEYDHDPKVISATTLIGPARAWALKRRHENELTMDVSDMLALRIGTAIHDSLEKVGVFNERDFKEVRFYADFQGYTISGKMDAVIDGVIRDNKSTSVNKYLFKDYDDYVKQFSIYRWILDRNGIEVAPYAWVDFFFTDWSKKKARESYDYPQIRYKEVKIPLLSLEETERYIADRLLEFSFAEQTLPECTKEELWQTETKYAVYRKNKDGSRQQKATKIFGESEKEEAERYATDLNGEVEKRPGKVKRCGYCSAAPFWEQFKNFQLAGLLDE